MSLTFATQLTAGFTAILGVGAIFTAVFAVLAFKKQSKEVSDQAEMLRLTSDQLAEQRTINAEQTRVLQLQARELRASLDARERASLELRQQYASTIVAWQDPPRDSVVAAWQGAAASWLVVAYVRNTGQRPVRDVSVRWYSDGKPISDREELTACLMPDDQPRNFNCRAGGTTIVAGIKAIVQFRTVGDDWWCAGTDGSLVGGMEITDAPLLTEEDGHALET
jgi:hypothetical protein